MRGELVAVDLETTGFDAVRDEIIEVAAVRIVDGELVEEFSTLVNPARPIPETITLLTGISDDDVLNAPSAGKALESLRSFVGAAPWIAHNISFDAGFLNKRKSLQNNTRIDTYELASILLPRAPRYNLSALTAMLGIDIGTAHRALSDARATAKLYLLLWQRALELPTSLLKEILLLAGSLPWDARAVFEAALKERAATGTERYSLRSKALEPIEFEPLPLRKLETTTPLDYDAIEAIFSPHGALAKTLPAYEHRTQQVDMALSVAGAFNNNRHLLIEAGTGTGKSMAYLVPAALWAYLNRERVVISTNTINLQEQLMMKDIPTLRLALGEDIQAALMKGRGNYLCPRRLETARKRHPTNVDELRTIAKILVWLLDSESGDRGEISLRGPEENAIWGRLSAEDEGCGLERCRVQMAGTCPFYKARRAAESAHLVIVNHALLISDAASSSRVLPEYERVVVDEAHHLEDAVTSGLTFTIDESMLRRRLADLGTLKKGLLGNLVTSVTSGATPREAQRISEYAGSIAEAIEAMEVHIGHFFAAAHAFALQDNRGGKNDYSTQIRVTEEARLRPTFSPLVGHWATLVQFFDVIASSIRELSAYLFRMQHYNLPDHDDLQSGLESAARYLETVALQITAFLNQPDPNTIYWLSLPQNGESVSLHAAPLHVGSLIEQHLWTAKESVVLTSATLQTNRSFAYLQSRLNAEGIDTAEVGSPFDYKSSTLLYVPNDIPDPTHRFHYQQTVERAIIELAAALGGRTLALFTSYAQLRLTAQAIAPRLALGGIIVFDQSDGSSRQSLLDGFTTSDKAVLLGTRSFWEGVDIPGEALSALVIVRLPFAVPNDPVFAARSETYADPFNEYAVPDAILRFRQGFGRLIRTRTDRGVVVVLDNRVITKSYGRAFLEALPECTVEYGALEMLPERASRWLS